MSEHRLVDLSGRPLTGKRTPPPRKGEEMVGHNAHNITLTALALALAKHFIVTADDAAATAFVEYFVDQSRKMAAQTGVAAIAASAEEKTGQLAAMLIAKHAEAKRHDGG